MSGPPTTLGKYQIIREIARSNDIVYEAYDPAMDRRVALKELNMPSGATDQQRKDRVQRFERECRAGGRLAHPNIMTVYEFGEDGSRYFMAMEYLDGHTLRQELDTKGALEPERAVEIALAVLKGLEHAHTNGVVHRDIKPDNIQLTSAGVKITDFGIARLTFQPNLTMDGQVFGTPSYMSPEQVRGGDIDVRSDIFSLGVVLYEMLAGQKPFSGDSVISITYAILNHTQPALHQVGYGIQQVVERALEKSSALRYETAAAMADALVQAQTDSRTGAFGPPMTNPYLTPVPGSAIPQMNTPYGGTQAPPPVYNYNPYQPGPHQTGPVPPAGFPFPLPTYYPPPPRKPLLNPDQEALLKRIGLITLVLATFFAVVMMTILYFTGSLTPKPAPAFGGSAIANPSRSTNLDRAQASLAALELRNQAQQAVARANAPETSMGRETDLRRAAELWKSSAEIEPDANLARSDREEAAICYMGVFLMQRARGVTGSELRSWVFEAAKVAPSGTDVARWAESERAAVR